MKISYGGKFNNGMIKLMDKKWLDNARVAGKTVAKCLNYLQNKVNEKTDLTALQLSKEVENIIINDGCIPTFKGYKNFPEAVCISVNNELVHGIPKDIRFNDGDIISFDLGATYNGSIGDAAITCVYGEYKHNQHNELVSLTKKCLDEAIKNIKIGNRVGSIGETIFNCLKNNKKYDFNLIQNYGGHGISTDVNGKGIPHSDPFISNKDISSNGPHIVPGMVLAIEPMICIGSTFSTVSNDGWTVKLNNISAHFEHTIYIGDENIEIITL